MASTVSSYFSHVRLPSSLVFRATSSRAVQDSGSDDNWQSTERSRAVVLLQHAGWRLVNHQNVSHPSINAKKKNSNKPHHNCPEAGQTTVNKWASISLYNPSKWCGPDKAVQSNTLWLNLNKINEVNILQSADKQGNPSFHFHAPGSKRRYPCTQTASAVPK